LIWLLPTPLPLFSISKLDRRHRKTKKRDSLLNGEGEREWGRSLIYRRESLVLYKSFNTLWGGGVCLTACREKQKFPENPFLKGLSHEIDFDNIDKN
jgi:hypothetical protein